MSEALILQQQSGGGPSAPSLYRPTQVLTMPGNTIARFSTMPKGVVLHGSRSGVVTNSIDQEFIGTANYAMNPSHGLGWHITVGNDRVAEHIPPTHWGWHARAASSRYLAVEFAQPVEVVTVTDAQIRAFVWWLYTRVFPVWPNLSLHMPTHHEVEISGETGMIDGKTDCYRGNDPRLTVLRTKIVDRWLDTSWRTA